MLTVCISGAATVPRPRVQAAAIDCACICCGLAFAGPALACEPPYWQALRFLILILSIACSQLQLWTRFELVEINLLFKFIEQEVFHAKYTRTGARPC